MSVHLKEYAPAVALRPYVVQYWEGLFMGKSTAVLEQKVIPSGYIELVLHLSDARCELKIKAAWEKSAAFSLVGFWTTPFTLQFKEKVEVFAIRFKPEAMYCIFGVPAAEFLNCSANLEEVFGPSFASFCLQIEALKTVEKRIQLADQYLISRLYKAEAHGFYFQAAADLIRNQKGGITVESLSDSVCISPRQLEREFKNKLGVSPKTYIRIARLNTVLDFINKSHKVSLAQLSYLCGYSDQPHFIKDFKSLTGELPSFYLSEQESFIHF